MNQKYLQGCSSQMKNLDEVVFLEASPENITAFLYKHRMAKESLITTVDDKPFLTARMGLIDVCPDQDFLLKQLNPIYVLVETEEIPAPELKTVSREVAESEPCPRPDWNYLKWDGYSNEQYAAVISGESLLDWKWDDDVYKMELKVSSYMYGGNLAIEMVDWTDEEPEDWGTLTVNLPEELEKDCAFVDVNNLGEEILPWLRKNGLAKPTGRIMRSGYVEYPEYRFNAGRLQELDPQGYAEYSKQFDRPEKGENSSRKESHNHV